MDPARLGILLHQRSCYALARDLAMLHPGILLHPGQSWWCLVMEQKKGLRVQTGDGWRLDGSQATPVPLDLPPPPKHDKNLLARHGRKSIWDEFSHRRPSPIYDGSDGDRTVGTPPKNLRLTLDLAISLGS